MIITTIEEKIIVYCNRVAHILSANSDVHRDLIERISQNIGAPVRTVYKEIQCGETCVKLNNTLTIKGRTVYSMHYNILLNDYVFPNRLIACYKGVCWTCASDYNLHVMKLEHKWFDYIASGRKNIEGRLYDEKRRRIRIGDCILFKSTSDRVDGSLYTIVIGLRRYNSFREMLISEGIERVLPGIYSINEGINVYYKYYSPVEEQKYGVLAIEVDLL